MCFSAEASFVSGGLILGAGLYNFHKRQADTQKSYLLLVPVLFGVQQISEGFVWLGVSGFLPEMAHWFFIYLFSFFATSLWPAFMPFSVWRFEERNPNKQILLMLSVGGFLIASYLLWSSFFYSSIELKVKCSQLDCNSLAYLFDMPYSGNWINYIYLFFVISPLIVSSHKTVRYIVSPAFFISFLVGALLSKSETFPSVWCFFAALMSISIFLVKTELKQKSSSINE